MRAEGGGRSRPLLVEASGLLFVVTAALAVLGHLASTPWAEHLFSDGDSLALPLFVQSMHRGEPFEWVMTSQLLAFPELPLYLLSVALTGGVIQTSLVVNAVVNAVVFYGGARLLASGVLADRSRGLRVGSSVAATATLLLLAATEGRGLINVGSFSGGILLTTYYSGVALAGVWILALMSGVTRGFASGLVDDRRRRWTCLAAVFAVSAATTFSNPLFALQFTAPAVVTLLLLLVLARMSRRTAAVLGGVLLVGAVLGYASRGLARSLIAVDASTYLHLERAGQAVDAFILQMRVVGSATSGKIELLVVGLLLVLAASTVVAAVATQSRERRRGRVSTSSTAVALFVVVSCLSLLLGVVVTGSLVSRYLLPLAAFPVLLVVPLCGEIARRVSRRAPALGRNSGDASHRGALVCAVLSASALAAGIAVSAPPLAVAAEQAGSTPERQCLEDWLGDRTRSGVASFWTARPLELYGPPSLDVQQVNFDFTAQLWMNNTAAYRGTTFSFVLADRDPDWSALALAHLGEPSAVVTCPTFDIYDYAGTDGERILNRIVSDSIERADREHGL